ncbi:uncharacterized protein isoform X1 [Leptinotarsa decemlineata]|uniref:uncharacterized protein isoform X1 n=1 Tax=Leptinotarsa decemlineata TaxID=7539 RepID=UPI003D30BFB5
MSDNRVQKLLFSEYSEFEDMVLIESPFAQTTKDGTGIRQVHLGLTPSKLVLATDVLPPVEYVNFTYSPLIDPETETFELIAIYPVECVNLSVYRRKKTQALKARFCNNRVLYFELGGFEKRAMFWNLWCERVRFLCPGESGSSRSETSVGTSSTGSTLYLLDKKLVAVNGIKQLWCKFGPNSTYDTNSIAETINTQVKSRSKWTDRHLYLGKNYENGDYQPVVKSPVTDDFVVKLTPEKSKIALRKKYPEIITYMEEKDLSIGDTVQVNRFGYGINEGCHTGLFLTVEDYAVPHRYTPMVHDLSPTESISAIVNYEQLAESAVLVWEFYKVADPDKYKIKHRRRYGLATKPLFLYGFGEWALSKGAKYSLHLKRAVSEVTLSSRFKELELGYASSKKQLTASLSQQELDTNSIQSPKSPAILFWTPGYRYRPRTRKELYEERTKQLKKITEYHETFTKRKRKKRRRKFFKKFYHSHNKDTKDTDEDSIDEPFHKKSRKKKHSFIYNMFSSKIDDITDIERKRKPQETAHQCLKRILIVDRSLTAWDFDSTNLAEQLTMIDRDLFLKIQPSELNVLVWQGSSINAPNITAILEFSQRISSLLASEVLNNDSEKSRARLVARWINVANKCHRISNFHSCRTVLCGLQSPAIYRLKKTWAYIRKKHASKYQNFEFLCRLYRDPRLATYQKTFFILSQSSPFLPCVGDVFSRLLGKVPEYITSSLGQNLSRTSSIETTKSFRTKSTELIENMIKCPTIFNKLLKVFTLTDSKSNQPKVTMIRERCTQRRTPPKFKGLYEYYKPFDDYEDSRMNNLKATKLFLEKCQLGAINYNFGINELAKSYLLKARYQEDRENFFNSLRIESSHNCYESKQ